MNTVPTLLGALMPRQLMLVPFTAMLPSTVGNPTLCYSRGQTWKTEQQPGTTNSGAGLKVCSDGFSLDDLDASHGVTSLFHRQGGPRGWTSLPTLTP